MEIMNNINHIYIDGNDIKDKKIFHKKIGEALNVGFFIHGYGYNLDALIDVMTCGAGLNCVLYWQHSESSKKNLGIEYFNKIIDTLKEVENYQIKQCELYGQYKNDSPFKF
ncbi:barstar family protein, partial [Testudinibacter sp. TR-2022]